MKNSKSYLIWILATLISFFVFVAFIPVNKIYYIKNAKNEIRLSRIDRSSFFHFYGTYFTLGDYHDKFYKPDVYISPRYTDGGPFDDGCFELFIEFETDKTYIYGGSRCITKNLTPEFQFIELPNAFGVKSWLKLREDKTGRYIPISCTTGIEIKK